MFMSLLRPEWFFNCRRGWITAIRLAGVALAGYYSSTALLAGTVDAYLNGEMTRQTITRTVDDGANWYQTTTGAFVFTRTGGDYTGLFLPTSFYAFCIEPREFVAAGNTYTYTWDTLDNGATNIGGMGTARADQLRELFGRYYPDFTMMLDPQHGSALQIAAWEIVRETSGNLDVYNGTTRYINPEDPAALALAQVYVQSLDGSGPRLNDVYALTSLTAQDIVIQADPVPEPALSAIIGVLLTGLALRARRRVP
jgi:hypothetical protein